MPSARPAHEIQPTMKLWRDRGYKIALQRDLDACAFVDISSIKNEYEGYAKAVNGLVKIVLKEDPEAHWIVAAGDDTEPDLVHAAHEIARQCEQHFYALHCHVPQEHKYSLQTYGVMQPTGDRWGHDRNTHVFTPRINTRVFPELQVCSQCGQGKDTARHMIGAYIDRVAGSPWMGREFCLRVNQGRGPLWPDYYHMGCDEELQAVAIRLGVFWQRPDLNQLHKHWGRAKPGESMGHQSNMPDFLKRANSAEGWNTYKKLFAKREAAGFPGSEPL